MTSTAAPITIRTATAADDLSLEHLAALDSRDVPAGDVLVVERHQRIVAAVAVQTLEAIADPFERTADLVSLLRRQAVARRNARPARRHFGLVARAA
ncbi:MAG: hypothetical protein M3389_03370 [Actinomycetota bacterium]|nr:hypothetical protein [Actinomycetota bacterium]